MKNLLLLFIIFILLVALGCKKTNSCGVSSIDQLPWAINLVSGKGACIIHEGAKFYSYNYKKTQVFYLTNMFSSNSSCNQAVYNCSGEQLLYNEKVWADFIARRKNEKLLWEK